MRSIGCSIMWAALWLAVETAVLEGQPRHHLEVRGSRLPLYEGDATVGPLSSWGWTLGAGTRLGRSGQAHVEAFYTLSPMDTDPYHLAPRLHLAGLLLGGSRPPTAGWSLVASIGAGVLSVQPVPLVPCEPPCFREGGPHYTRATLPTLIGRLGVDARLLGDAHLRVDGRIHRPIGAAWNAGNTGDTRFELGVGVLYAF
jgi:hypothetical protein